MGLKYTGLSLLCFFLWLSFGQDSDCPPTTFSCGNGCIPREWVCDKVKDCKNGHDEDENYCTSLGVAEAKSVVSETSTATTTPMTDHTETETTHEAETSSTTSHSHSSTTEQPMDSTEGLDDELLAQIPICSPEKRARVESCYQKIGEWVQIFGSIELNIGLFSSTEQLEKIENSCKVYEQFRQCLGDIYKNPSGCILPEALDSWDRFEAYTCQLLLPAATDHAECFQKINNHSCVTNHYNIQRSTLMANFCNPIFSVKRILDCASLVQNSCSADSQDVISAISTETSVSDSLYACSSSVSSFSSHTVSACPTSQELESCSQILHQINVSQLSTFVGNSDLELESACKAYILYRECLSEKIGSNQACWPTDNRFQFMDTVFSTYCSSDVLEEASAESDCLNNLKSDPETENCRLEEMPTPSVEEQSDPDTTCTALGNLLAFLTCSQSLAGKQCNSSGEELVKMVHGRLSDQLISLDCDGISFGEYDEEMPSKELGGSAADHFSLSPSLYPKCSEDDETGALACLLGLFELQQIFGDFGNKNVFVELANENSTLVTRTCSIYDDYEDCLQTSIFDARGGRCSFSANINKMARIGLAPLCNRTTRESIQKHRSCIVALHTNGELNQCAAKLNELGRLVVDLIQGGTDYTLCRVFYLVRELFACIEPKISSICGSEPLEATRKVKQLITEYGVEEGCPAMKPHNFDSFASMPSLPIYDYDYDSVTTTTQATDEEPNCETEGYSQFNFCLKPLGQFKPNALSVISDPRQISKACVAYNNFHECRESIWCKPDWSAGVDSMFDYVCNSGLTLYSSVKRCLKRTSLRKDMKACVEHFTKNANSGDSCHVSNQFLACSSITVMEKCGERAVEFIESFITRFAQGTDPLCRMQLLSEATRPVEREEIVVGIGCGEDEMEELKRCEEVMYPTVDKIRDLFKGGIGAFISNMNLLSEIFSEGCENSASFQQCARSAIVDSSSCTVGSCVIKAGQGICNSPNKANLITKHLNCVFTLISEPEFGRCIRSSFSGATLANIDLEGLKKLVPEFVSCAAGIIERKCGLVPLNIMKSVGAQPHECLISLHESVSTTTATFGSPDQESTTIPKTSTTWESTDSAEATAEPFPEPEASSTSDRTEIFSTVQPTATTTYETPTSTSVEEPDSATTSEYAAPETTPTEQTTTVSPTAYYTETSRSAEGSTSSQDSDHTVTSTTATEPETAAEITTSTAEPQAETTTLPYFEPESTSESEATTASTSSYAEPESTAAEIYSETTTVLVESTESEAEPETTTDSTPLVKTTPSKKQKTGSDSHPDSASASLGKENSGRKSSSPNRTNLFISIVCCITGFCFLKQIPTIRW